MTFDINKLFWTREPAGYSISPEKIEIITQPRTDLWQRTYYHFRNDNAPVLQMKTVRLRVQRPTQDHTLEYSKTRISTKVCVHFSLVIIQHQWV